MSATRGNGFTGRHMLAIMVTFFGTIITVNVTMAWLASASWSGMLAKNTYVASQDFNKNADRARRWASQGFRGEVRLDNGAIRYRLEGPADVVAAVDHVRALFHRPVGDKQDFSVTLTRNGDMFSAPDVPAAGPWIVDLAAMRDGEIVFHQAVRLVAEEP